MTHCTKLYNFKIFKDIFRSSEIALRPFILSPL